MVYCGKRIPTAASIEILPLPSEEVPTVYLEGPFHSSSCYGDELMHSYGLGRSPQSEDP